MRNKILYHSKGVAREMQGRCKALGRLMSKPRVWLEYAYSMARVWLEYIFVRKERTLCPSRTNSQSVEHGLRFLRNAAMLLLLMVVGIGGVKAQVGPNYSGTYYIASDYQTPKTTTRNYNATTLTNNYYLCPTENWISYGTSGETMDTWTTGDDKPFLTTYKARNHNNYDITKAKWTIEYYTTVSGTDYYYFKHSSGKYMVLNKQIDGVVGNNNAAMRLRVHLETLTSEQLEVEDTRNLALFAISQDSRSVIISPKTQSTYHLTVNNGNGDFLRGNGTNKGYIQSGNTQYGTNGTIAIYNDSNDDNQYLYLEEVISRPTITNTSSQIVMSHSEAETTIYYTINGSNPSITNYAGTGPAPLQIDMLQNSATLKVVAAKSDNLPSCVSEIRVVPNPTISLASSPIVYNGSEQTPTFSVMDDNTEIPESEYTVSYSNNNINAGETVTVTITDNAGGNYIVYGSTTFNINPKPLTITANNKTITYGDEPTHDGVTYGEFAGTETESVLTGTLTYSYNYEQYGDAGSYTITPSGLSNENYDITFVPGTLTVNPKSLTVTANNNSITYGEAPAGNGVTYSGFVGEQTAAVLSGSLNYDYSYAQYDDVGNAYTIIPKGLSSTNYTFSFVAGTLTVNQREAGIEWGNTSLGYNGSAQVPIATATNVVNNDEVIVTVTGAQTDVGTDYTATATGLTGAKAGNYVLPSSNTTTTFIIVKGTFTPIVSIDGWTYGETANTPSVNDNVSGGDVVYSYSVKGENDYSATVPTHAGDYTVKVTIAANGNYESAEATTDFTISPKSIGDGTDAATGIDIKMTQVDDNVEVTYVKDGTTTLVENEDYNVEVQTQGDDNHVIVTGIGNYTGSVRGLFVKSVFTKPTGVTEATAVYQASSDLAKPDGITPYIVRKVNPSIGTMVITPIDYIPKDVPVLMLRTNETTGFLASPKEDAITEITAQTKNSNQLKVAPEGGIDVEAAQTYIFYNGEFVLTKKGTLSAGKFFLYNPNFTATPSTEEEQQQGGGNAPSLSVLRFVIEEEPTGIINIKDDTLNIKNDDFWFSIDGRKLSGKPIKAGLYIRNGRKTIIKRK